MKVINFSPVDGALTSSNKIKKPNQIKDNIIKNIEKKNIIRKKIIIPIIIFFALVIIITIVILVKKYTRKIKKTPDESWNITEETSQQKDNTIKITTSNLDFKEVETLIGLEIVETNYIILNETINNIIESLNDFEKIDIKPINTEINYTSPGNLENPTKASLKLVKSDVEFYKSKFEELSEKSNNISEIILKSIENIYSPLNKTKEEITKVLYKFEEMMRNLSIPLLLKEMILNNNERNLNEDEIKELDEDKLNIINKVEEYKNETNKLNILYNDYFNYINETVKNISDEIKEIPNIVVDIQNKIEEGKSNFIEKVNDLTELEDMENFHQNLIGIKNSFKSIQNEVNLKQNLLRESINNIENDYRNVNNFNYRGFNEEVNTTMVHLNSSSNLIKNEIITYTEQKSLNTVYIVEYYASNVIVDLIKESLEETLKAIKNEEALINNELEEFNSEINVEQKTSLDLLFIMDITGSMKPYLNQVQNNILNIINRIIAECPGIDVNLGLIAYREVHQVDKNLNIEFTQNHLELKNIIKDIQTISNNDYPEDVAWGIEKATEKNWKSNARFAILMADYPCHGTKYHSSNLSDDYPNGAPDRQDIEESIKILAEKNVSLFCLKITENTQIMFEIFENIYNNYENIQFQIIPMKSSESLSNVVVVSSVEIYTSQRSIKPN